MIVFAAATGLRPGEWIALEHRDLDGDARVVYVRRHSYMGGCSARRRGGARARWVALEHARGGSLLTPVRPALTFCQVEPDTEVDAVHALDESTRCTFCLTPAAEVTKLITGPGVYICDRCVQLCVSILDSEDANEEQLPAWGSLDDDQLLERLPRIADVAAQVDGTLHQWVAEARRRGVSWERIGAALEISRQSAWERFAVD